MDEIQQFIEATKGITWPAAFVVVAGIACFCTAVCKLYTGDWPWE